MAAKLGAAEKAKAGVHPDVLRTLVSRCDAEKAEMDSARGELGSIIKDAEDTHGINRKAFKLILTMKRMGDDKRNDFLRSFDDYREKLGFNDQIDMFDEGDEQQRRNGQAAKAEGDDRAAENAKALKGGIKQLDAVH